MNRICKVELTDFKAETAGSERWISGIASTPTVDRQGDIVEPKGARFSLPLPFLLRHDVNRPLGLVREADVTDAGIRIRAKIAAGIDYVDAAWAELSQGLVPGLSIGFRVLEAARRKGGQHILTFDLMEVSAVTIAANADARLVVGKALPILAKKAGVTRIPPLPDHVVCYGPPVRLR